MNASDDEYAKAMAVLNDLAADYLTWAAGDLSRLDKAYHKALMNEAEQRKSVIREDLFRAAHDMKGQGATFGYELITDIGNHLCRYIERQDFFEETQMKSIKMHIDALHQILEQRLIDDGGEVGQNLKQKIEAL